MAHSSLREHWLRLARCLACHLCQTLTSVTWSSPTAHRHIQWRCVPCATAATVTARQTRLGHTQTQLVAEPALHHLRLHHRRHHEQCVTPPTPQTSVLGVWCARSVHVLRACALRGPLLRRGRFCLPAYTTASRSVTTPPPVRRCCSAGLRLMASSVPSSTARI